MQKLVTIYLDSYAQSGESWMSSTVASRHGIAEELLQDELAAGWRVVQFHSFGGADGAYVRGWLTVLLEKNQ
jgi:hypothetical protein